MIDTPAQIALHNIFPFSGLLTTALQTSSLLFPANRIAPTTEYHPPPHHSAAAVAVAAAAPAPPPPPAPSPHVPPPPNALQSNPYAPSPHKPRTSTHDYDGTASPRPESCPHTSRTRTAPCPPWAARRLLSRQRGCVLPTIRGSPERRCASGGCTARRSAPVRRAVCGRRSRSCRGRGGRRRSSCWSELLRGRRRPVALSAHGTGAVPVWPVPRRESPSASSVRHGGLFPSVDRCLAVENLLHRRRRCFLLPPFVSPTSQYLFNSSVPYLPHSRP